MPLVHPPGNAQADFGEALVDIGGIRMKAHFLVMDLPYCDAYFVKAYPGETTEAFCDAHNCSFAFFGGVPLEIRVDRCLWLRKAHRSVSLTTFTSWR